MVKSYYEKIKDSLKNLSERVKIHIGWIPHSKLPLFYRAANIFVRTSKYENFGLGTVESMACRTPVIATNAVTFPEIVGDKVTLYKPEDSLDLADKVIALLTDHNLYKSVLEYQSLRVHELFDINIIAQKYIELYASLIHQ